MNDKLVEEGVTEVETSITKNNKIVVDEGIEDIKSTERVRLPFTVDTILDSVKQIKIDTVEEFIKIKSNVLRAYYVYLFVRDNSLSLVTDTKLYYLIDLEVIKVEEIANLLQYRQPKKIVVGIEDFKDFIIESTTSFWDLKLVANILWDLQIEGAKELLDLANIKRDGKKNIYLFSANLINIAKELNIYVEKNKLNSKLMLELEILKESILCEKKGIPINLELYVKYKETVEERYSDLNTNLVKLYGEGFAFNNVTSLINYLHSKGCISSLEPSILKDECSSLYKDLATYNTYKSFKKHNIKDGSFIVKYNTFSDYEIKVDFLPENNYLSEDIVLVKGVFNDLYLRVLAELTKDKKLIEATSSNAFLEFINKNILEDEAIGVYSEIFIRAYSNNCFESKEIKQFAEDVYQTIITNDDIDFMNNLFKDKAPGLMNFMMNFNGNDVIYNRYNKNIFQPTTKLDNYIKQIMSLVFKTAVSYIQSANLEYTLKYKNDDSMNIELMGFYDYKILLSTTSKSKPIAIDILNRYMVLAYKKYIKNTKYYNVTSVIEGETQE